MASETYTYFYACTNTSGTNWSIGNDITGDSTLTLYESAPFVDGLFTHYTKANYGTNDQEPLIGSNGVTYYYRGVTTINGTSYPVFSTSPIGGGKGGTNDFFIGTDTPISSGASFNSNNLLTGTSTTVTGPNSGDVCYFAGTLISTPAGPKAVETLQIGDLIHTHCGPMAVRFISRSSHSLASLRSSGRLPVRISAGSFGQAGPTQDLWMSPSHAVHLAGHLVEAGALVNGTSVVQTDDLDTLTVTYYNIELEEQAIVTANGLEVESYYANYRASGLSREDWANYDEYLALYGESLPMKELDLPRIPFARQLPIEVRELLQAEASPQVALV